MAGVYPLNLRGFCPRCRAPVERDYLDIVIANTLAVIHDQTIDKAIPPMFRLHTEMRHPPPPGAGKRFHKIYQRRIPL